MAKRGNGEGSIYRRKSDGLWVGSLSLPDRKRKVFYGKKQSEVIAKLDEAANELRKGMLAVGVNTTLQEYLENWLENVHKPTIRLSTYLNYRKMLKNYLVPGLGKIKVQKKNTDMLSQNRKRQKADEWGCCLSLSLIFLPVTRYNRKSNDV